MHTYSKECLCDEVIPDGDDTIHVIPNNDLEPHFLFDNCHCHPKWDPDADYLFAHNSFDRRELSESDYRNPKRLCN